MPSKQQAAAAAAAAPSSPISSSSQQQTSPLTPIEDSGVLLERFIESVAPLPFEITTSFTTIRDLDEKVNSIIQETREAVAAGRPVDIDARFKEVYLLGQEKIDLSLRCYEEVDKVIRRLDEDLRRLDATIDKERIKKMKQQYKMAAETLQESVKSGTGITGLIQPSYVLSSLESLQHRQSGVPFTNGTSANDMNVATTGASSAYLPPPPKRMPAPVPTGMAAASAAASASTPASSSGAQKAPRRGQRTTLSKQASQATTPSAAQAQTAAAFGYAAGKETAVPAPTPTTGIVDDPTNIDPNEPVYCVCRRVSYGQMVACDNDNCPYEWFHFNCVGLTEEPKGTWYCPECRKKFLPAQ